MRKPIAVAAVTASASLFAPLMMASPAQAQLFGQRRGTTTPAPGSAPVDPRASRTQFQPPSGTMATAPDPSPYKRDYKEGEEIPSPISSKEIAPVVGPLPTEPLEPYLITKENGPFMVMAQTFRGPDAPRQALALVLELRGTFKLPAYILLPKKYPGRSNIRGVPPQAPPFLTRDDVGLPELIRTLDEAAVMVGDEKTIKDATALMHRVKKLHPICIDGQPQALPWMKGKGLSRAQTSTNPLIPAEDLFPRQPDVLVARMNDGPHNIRHCPGRFTLQVAAFTGRQSLDAANDARLDGFFAAKKSPLASAADDAERLAEALSKDKEVMKLGAHPYVFHDRYSSRVTMGSFNDPNDPAARALHDRLIEIAVDLNQRKVTDTMIVPASAMMDLKGIKSQIDPGVEKTSARR